MFQVGKTFTRAGKTFCLLKILDFNGERYAVFSVEDNKLSFVVYKIVEDDDNYHLSIVNNEGLKCILFEMIGNEGE